MSSEGELLELRGPLATQVARRRRRLAGVHAGVQRHGAQLALAERAGGLAGPGPTDRLLALRDGAAEADRPALNALLGALFEEQVACARAAGEERIDSVRADAVVESDSAPLPYWEAADARRWTGNRDRRVPLSRSVDAARAAGQGLYARLHQKGLALREAHRLGSPAALVALAGLELPTLEGQVRAFLKETRDPWEAWLEHRARREGLPRGLQRHDLRVALEGLSLRADVSWGGGGLPGLLPLPVEAWRLPEALPATVSLDDEYRSTARPGLHVGRVREGVESIVRVQPAKSPADLERGLRGLFVALACGSREGQAAGPSGPWGERIDLAHAECATALWLHLPEFGRRQLRLPSRLADDARRLFLFRTLGRLRTHAAGLLAALELEKEGPGEAATEAFRALHREALGADWGTAGALETDLTTAAVRIAAGLEGLSLAQALLHGFGEDACRNPGVGELLFEAAKRGALPDAKGAPSPSRWFLER